MIWMKIQLPMDVNYIINKLIEHGHEAYAVGGCVRDSILKKEPEDWDITTSASPMEVKDIFRRTVDTGLQHGTVTVLIEKEGYEVTTYRIDGEYEDNRRPKEVEFTKSLDEDLKRRDFTINAMAYNDTVGLVDIFQGYEDLEKGMIRCVGSARERFDEDALRILRAVRFSAQLGFGIDTETLEAIKEKAQYLKNISAERIRVELSKLLVSNHPEKLIVAYETGITKVVLPEFDKMMETTQNHPHHSYSVGIHTIKAIQEVDSFDAADTFTNKERLILKLVMLLHDAEKPNFRTVDEQGVEHFYGHDVEGAKSAKKLLRRLKFDNETIDMVSHLIHWHDYRFELTEKAMRRAIHKIGKEYMPLLLEVKRADTLAQNPLTHESKLQGLKEARRLFDEIVKRSDCLSLKDLKLNGNDLRALGISEGIRIGQILNELLQMVLEVPSYNEKEILEQMVKEKYLSE